MKSQKPTEIDASFLYICPNTDCKNEHWLFFREVKVKNFKVACDCGVVFKPKPIDHIKICYAKKTPKESINDPSPVDSIPVDLLESCVKILDGYGFSRNESVKLVTKAYASTEDRRIVNVIRIALTSLEIQNV
jgi:hypothetical protein